jgi:hypothetical protein
MGLIRDEVLVAAHRGRELTAAGLVALAGVWLMWLNTHPGCRTTTEALPIRKQGIAAAGGSGNASRFPARTETTHQQDRSPKRNEGQRPTRRGRSARRWRGGRWPGALAPAWRVAPMPHGRGDGPGQSRRGMLSRFPVWQPPVFPLLQHTDRSTHPFSLVLFSEPQQVRAWA